MISNNPGISRLQKELKETIVDLEWLGNHARGLPTMDIAWCLRNLIERQRELRTLFRAQRYGLLHLIRRLQARGFVDCKNRMGTGMRIPWALGVLSSMEPSSS